MNGNQPSLFYVQTALFLFFRVLSSSCSSRTCQGAIAARRGTSEKRGRRRSARKSRWSCRLPRSVSFFLFSLSLSLSGLPPPAPCCWCCCTRESKGALSLSVPLLLAMKRTLQLRRLHTQREERREERESEFVELQALRPANVVPPPVSLYFFHPSLSRERALASPLTFFRSLPSLARGRKRKRAGLARACR